VLVALFEEEGRARVVLTRRSGRLRSHTGQVSFPGGLVDEGEAARDAALREAAEEVGIDPASVEVLGVLSPLTTLSTQAQLTPFVGLLAGRPELAPNPAEVDRAFDVALEELAADGVYRQEVWEVDGQSRPVHFFELDGETVWGATAQVLFELLVLVSLAAGWELRELS
jgi:8-oxo-dGTP pyrophosphatase MutT (NUDIX family)